MDKYETINLNILIVYMEPIVYICCIVWERWETDSIVFFWCDLLVSIPKLL